MITIDDYAGKVETFIGLWREKLITDFELVTNIDDLTSSVVYFKGSYVAIPDSQVPQRSQD